MENKKLNILTKALQSYDQSHVYKLGFSSLTKHTEDGPVRSPFFVKLVRKVEIDNFFMKINKHQFKYCFKCEMLYISHFRLIFFISPTGKETY